jgi:hypothetical protein
MVKINLQTALFTMKKKKNYLSACARSSKDACETNP